MMDVAFSNELSKSSCMALCLLYRARMSTQDGAPEVRQRLLNQSDEYFNHAVQQLQTGDIPLEAQLLAVFDLELFQVSFSMTCRAPSIADPRYPLFHSSSSTVLQRVTRFFCSVRQVTSSVSMKLILALQLLRQATTSYSSNSALDQR